MPRLPEPFRPDEHDLRHFLDLPYARYLAVKAKFLPQAQLQWLAAELRREYLQHLRQLPIVRLWPHQWLAEEWRRYARL